MSEASELERAAEKHQGDPQITALVRKMMSLARRKVKLQEKATAPK